MLNQIIRVSEKMIGALEEVIEGEVIQPHDAAYDEARAVWNGMIDRYPALIVRCQSVSDVIAAVRFAMQTELIVSVRGGGHNVAGYGTNDGGLVIDLSPLKAISVDPVARTVSAQGGVIWRELDEATQEFGLATPGGEVSDTGIAGLTLGGGVGMLRRKYGLSSDNLISVEVVTADGRLLHASEDENADLFWAVRGGGGNFGIVTCFEYKLYPVGPELYSVTVMYPFHEAERVMKAWRLFTETAPNEVSSICLLWGVPAVPDFPEELHNQNIVVLNGTYIGDVEEGARVLEPLRTAAVPLIDMSGVSSYLIEQTGFDPFFPSGDLRYYWKSLNLAELSDGLIDAVLGHTEERPSPKTIVAIRHLGGAMADVPAEATAFGDRSAQFNLSLDATWADPAADDANIAWTRNAWHALNRYSDGGVYLNFPGFQEEGQVLIQRQFGKNVERLKTIKRKYDPTNFFRLNQNIEPVE